jgi:diacylglycerol kinase (ATP)
LTTSQGSRADTPKRRASRVLLVSPGAGSITGEVVEKLRRTFPDHEQVEFDPELDLRGLVAHDGSLVVAGGDGTVGFALRALAGTEVEIGILSLGTFNNFAGSLGIPEGLDQMIEVVKSGTVRPLTLGRVNGHAFLEAAALGMFGEVIALGEAAKDRAFGELGERLRRVGDTRPFRYRLSGDLEASGRALSLVFANTPTTGARIAVGDATPEQPYLELSLGVGESRSDLLSRMIAAALRRGPPPQPEMNIHFEKLRVRTRPRVAAYADNQRVGQTPVTVESWPDAVRVVVPR